jgi:hypothetical protein
VSLFIALTVTIESLRDIVNKVIVQVAVDFFLFCFRRIIFLKKNLF